MHGFRRLVHELHRRSLWHVLAVYLGGSRAVIEVVDWLTQNVGLPEWTPEFALVLLLIGLPIVLATAFVQEGFPGRTPDAAPGTGPESTAEHEPGVPTPTLAQPSDLPVKPRSRLFTWRKAILGGVGAFSLLGIGVAGYFVMWRLGRGPAGSLLGKGVLEVQDPVVLADFENRSSDPTAGDLVMEALRVDLIDSDVVALAPMVRVQQVLERMGLSPDSVVSAALAREVAQRAGFKAVIEGEVASVGEGYVLTARLRAAETGAEHAAFRESASSPDELIRAIDKLSERIRNKVGESLPASRAGEPRRQPLNVM